MNRRVLLDKLDQALQTFQSLSWRENKRAHLVDSKTQAFSSNGSLNPGRTLLSMDEEADIGSGHVGEEEENKEEEKEEKGMEGSREMIVDKPYKNTTDVDCLKPAILQFPRTPWNKEERQSGWVRFFSILVYLKGKRSRYERQPFSCQISITWLPLCFSAPADLLSKVNSLPQTMGFFMTQRRGHLKYQSCGKMTKTIPQTCQQAKQPSDWWMF